MLEAGLRWTSVARKNGMLKHGYVDKHDCADIILQYTLDLASKMVIVFYDYSTPHTTVRIVFRTPVFRVRADAKTSFTYVPYLPGTVL